MKHSTTITTGTLTALCAAIASGSPIANESFDYAAATGLNGQLGGSGWNDLWVAPAGVAVADPLVDLTYPDLFTTGNSLFNALESNVQNIERPWNATDLTDDGDEVWFSLMVNVTLGAADNDEFRFQLFQGGDTAIRNNGTDTMLVVDELGSVEIWGMDADNSLDDSTTISTGVNHLIVGQYIFSDTEGSDVWNLWIDPDLSVALGTETLSVTGDIITDGEEDGLASEIMDMRFIRNAMSVDELRIGTTFASVVPSTGSVADPILSITISGSDVIIGISNLDTGTTYQLQEDSMLSDNWLDLGAPFSGVTETDIPVDTTGKPKNFFRVISQ